VLFDWWKRRRRRRRADEPLTASEEEALADLAFFASLSPEEQDRLRTFVRAFAREKSWEGCGGFELTDEARVAISAQAGLLVLNLPHSFYRRVRSILVYPRAFRDQEGNGLAGQAMLGGPVALAWTSVTAGASNPRDGHNVVFHEFAHMLDMLDDFTDGMPPLGDAELERRWREICGRDFERLVDLTERGKRTLLGSYAATSPIEFFAVATEHFFEQPGLLREAHGDLYELLVAFYRQDPYSRRPRRRR